MDKAYNVPEWAIIKAEQNAWLPTTPNKVDALGAHWNEVVVDSEVEYPDGDIEHIVGVLVQTETLETVEETVAETTNQEVEVQVSENTTVQEEVDGEVVEVQKVITRMEKRIEPVTVTKVVTREVPKVTSVVVEEMRKFKKIKTVAVPKKTLTHAQIVNDKNFWKFLGSALGLTASNTLQTEYKDLIKTGGDASAFWDELPKRFETLQEII